jgi:cytochrome b561
MINDTKERYGVISKIFHWLMALLVGWQLLKLGDRIADGKHWVGETLVPWHVSIGTLLLALIVLRIIWALVQRKKRPQPPKNAFLVKAGHGLMYAVMLVLPLTGVMYLVGKGYGLKAFDVQLIAGGEKTAWLAELGHNHSTLAWILAALVVGHIVIALVHHFIKRDGILRRML